MEVVRPHPGHAVTWGSKLLRPEGLEDLLRHPHLPGPVTAGARSKGNADGISNALQKKGREAGRSGDDPLVSHAGLGEAEVERVVTQGGHLTVDRDQLLDVGDLRGQEDPVMGKPGLLRQGRRAHGTLHHGVPENFSGVLRVRAPEHCGPSCP